MENKLVIKSNDLISANYSLNLNEQKMVIYAITQLDKNNKETFNSISLNIREFIDLLSITDRNYDQIRDIARKLRKKEIIIDTDKFEYITGWFSSVTFNKSSGDMIIRFDDDLVPYLLQLKEKFTRYELKNILSMKSSYSVRAYELLKQYESIGRREFELDKLKECFGLHENEYSRIYDFEKWVLKVAEQEINNNTDIQIDYEKIKKGRKVVGIKFNIHSKNKDSYIEYLNQSYNIKEFKEKAGIESENFNAKQVLELYEIAVNMLIDDYESEADLFEYIRLNYLFMKKKKSVKNPFTYLRRALKEDYAIARGQIKFDYPID